MKLNAAPTPGNVLVLFLEDDNMVTLGSQPGWTVQDSYVGPSIVGFSVATHVVASGDGASFTINTGDTATGKYESYALYELANVDTGTPLNFVGHHPETSGTTTFKTPSGTPSVTGTLPLAAFVATNDSYTWSLLGQLTKDQYQGTFSLETAHDPLTTDVRTAISGSATLSQASTWPGVSELVLVKPAKATPTYNGCVVFPANDPVWNTQVTATPDPNSNAYIAAMLSVSPSMNVTTSHGSNVWIINQASTATSTYPLEYNGSVVRNINDLPFESTYNWQSKGATGATDHHLMIVSSANCHVWEGYSSANEATPPPSWELVTASPPYVATREASALEYNLQSPFPAPVPNSASDPGGGSVVLMGPLFPGLVRWEDYQNHAPHALELDVPYHSMLSNTFVYPAKNNCGGCQGTVAGLPPLGSRVVLSKSIALPTCVTNNTCKETAFVIESLQQYGAYLSDVGGDGFQIRMANDSSGADPWSDTDLSNLHGILINSTNFYFVKPPGCNSTIAACEGQNPPSS